MTQMSRIRLSTGIDMELAQSEPAGAGGGRPVLFLHGYTDSWYSHNGVLQALPPGVHAIAPSQRGHGGTDKPAGRFAMADFAADAIALMDGLGVARAAIVGHSMGSLIAQELALTHPDRVSAVVLNGSATTADNDALRGMLPEARRLADPLDRGFVSAFQSGTCVGPLGPGMDLEHAIDESMKMPAHAWVGVLEGLIAWHPPKPLGEIACPVLVTWGDRDEIFLRPEQDRLVAAIPQARLSVYEGVGHAPHWEQPARFTAEMMAFLDE